MLNIGVAKVGEPVFLCSRFDISLKLLKGSTEVSRDFFGIPLVFKIACFSVMRSLLQ